MSTQSDVYLARQPILDCRRRVIAYELLFRGDCPDEAHVRDDAVATARVISQAFGRLGLRSVVGGAAAFVNVDVEMLHSRRLEKLPRQQVVLELLETVHIDRAVVERCAELKQLGYRLALDDVFAIDATHEPLLELVDVVKIDILKLDPPALAALVTRLRLHGVRLLAEKVDTPQRARHCHALGFDLFQGFLFGRPALLAR